MRSWPTAPPLPDLRATAGALADFGRHHPTGAISGIFLIIVMTMVLLANIISPFRYDRTVARQLLPPMSEATLDDGTLWIGTDELGRDVVSRLLHGGRVSMFVGIMAPLIGVAFGTVFGIASAYFGKLFDLLTQRLVDTVLILPGIVVAMTITVAFGFTVPVGHHGARGQLQRQLRARGALACADAEQHAIRRGRTRHWKLRHAHHLPTPRSQLATRNHGADRRQCRRGDHRRGGLSFLGIGIQPPIPSWGNMLTTAQLNFDFAPHVAIAPGLAITFVVLAVNLFGDSLRDVLDPRLRNVR